MAYSNATSQRGARVQVGSKYRLDPPVDIPSASEIGEEDYPTAVEESRAERQALERWPKSEEAQRSEALRVLTKGREEARVDEEEGAAKRILESAGWEVSSSVVVVATAMRRGDAFEASNFAQRLSKLAEMEFPLHRAASALESSRGDLEGAIEQLSGA